MRIFLLISILSLSGCTHCSLTETVFDGKTSGINPYGSGDIIIERKSYWGTNACVVSLMNQEIL